MIMSAEPKLGDEARPTMDVSGEEPGPVVTPAEARRRQRALSQQLRRLYDDVVKEPVPDEFVKLLGRIDERHGEDPKGE